MKKAGFLIFLFLFSVNILSDDGMIDDLIYNSGVTPKAAGGANSYKAQQYKNDAQKVETKTAVNKTAPVAVQNTEKEKIQMEKDLKKAYLDLSKAYEENNPVNISKYELLSWKIKEEIKIADEKIAMAYQINEFYKGLKDFPNSMEMRGLINNATTEAKQYIALANQILYLKEKQAIIKKDLEQKQGEAQIIRQKEILKNLQNAHSKKYGQ